MVCGRGVCDVCAVMGVWVSCIGLIGCVVRCGLIISRWVGECGVVGIGWCMIMCVCGVRGRVTRTCGSEVCAVWWNAMCVCVGGGTRYGTTSCVSTVGYGVYMQRVWLYVPPPPHPPSLTPNSSSTHPPSTTQLHTLHIVSVCRSCGVVLVGQLCGNVSVCNIVYVFGCIIPCILPDVSCRVVRNVCNGWRCGADCLTLMVLPGVHRRV